MPDFDHLLWSLKNATSIDRGDPQHLVEHRTVELMREFPQASDEVVATMMRDEIVNAFGDERALLKWASPDTVARIRRTMFLANVREQSRRAVPAPTSDASTNAGNQAVTAQPVDRHDKPGVGTQSPFPAWGWVLIAMGLIMFFVSVMLSASH